MTQDEAMQMIREALRRSVDRSDIDVGMTTDLVEDKVLDSLDSMAFILELSDLSGKEFPETDLVKLGLYKVDRLVEFLTA